MNKYAKFEEYSNVIDNIRETLIYNGYAEESLALLKIFLDMNADIEKLLRILLADILYKEEEKK